MIAKVAKMRDYGKVFSSFWTSQTIRAMDDDARTLAIYLLTCPHGTIAGVFRLPDGYVCDDLNWEKTRVIKAFDTLCKGFVSRCETTKWVWINKHFEWNKPENPLQLKGAKKIALTIPDECGWKLDYMRLYAGLLNIETKPFINPLQTLSKPVTVTVTVTEAVTEAVTVTEAVSFSPQKSAEPPKENTELKKACYETRASYATAFFERYGTEPVSNAKVNSIIKQFVQRIGFIESPAVAAHYVTSNNSYYVARGHSFDCLLADAEKLRTEWATGKTMTQTRAMPALTSRESGRNIAAKSVFTPENTKHLQGNKLNLMGVENEVRAITD